MSPFSDHGAGARLSLALAACVALGAYYAWWALQMSSGYRWALEDPVGRDGAEIVFPLWTVTRVDGPDDYAISKVVKDIPCAGEARDLVVGDTVSVIGSFAAADKKVHVHVRELHVLRRYKEALGVIGFVCVVLAAPFAFRIERRRLVERG